MPLAYLRYKPQRLPHEALLQLANVLPGLIAPVLSVERGGKLEPEEIEVEPRALSADVVNAKDVSVVVFANFFAARETKLYAAQQHILEGILKFFADYDYNLSISVWVLLAPGSYGESLRS